MNKRGLAFAILIYTVMAVLLIVLVSIVIYKKVGGP